MTLNLISSLPIANDSQYTVFEFVYGPRDYRRHKAHLSIVLEELTFSLSTKIILEDKVLELCALLNQLKISGGIQRYTSYCNDISWADLSQTNEEPFPPQHEIVISIAWSSEYYHNDQPYGPDVICIQHNDTYGTVYMTPSYFLLNPNDRTTPRNFITTVPRIHSTLNELLVDIMTARGY
jgi:hypothetical protein